MVISILPPPIRGYVERHKAAQVATWIGALVIVVVVLASIAGMWVLRSFTVEQWSRQAEAASQSVASQTGAMFTTAEVILREISSEARRLAPSPGGLASRELNDVMRSRARSSDWIELISIVGLDGVVINNTRSFPIEPFSIADRDYIRAMVGGEPVDRFISRPVRNRANGGWTFYMSRRVLDERGAPLAIAVVGMSSAAISEHFRRQAVVAGTSISLFSDDWRLLARHPFVHERIGEVNRSAPGRASTEGRAEMVATPRFANGAEDARIRSSRRVEGFPLMVNLSIPSDVFLASWRWGAGMIAALMLVSSLALLATIAVVSNLAARREATIATISHLSEKASIVAEQRLALIEELESFSYSISHDLRAPLRALNGYSRLLEESLGARLGPDEARMFNEIRRNAERMSSLIDDLLSLSQVTAKPPRAEDVDLSMLGREVVRELREAEPGRVVEVVVQEEMRARGDRGYLRIALANLLGNSWKYTRSMQAPRIEFGRRADGVFYISDNGVGFDMEHAGQLFKAFHRLHGSEFDGNGIGLTIVHRILQRHQGGRIWVEAEKGRGATFFFTLGET